MHKTPSVSVIIPAYNDQDGVNRCLAALCEQSYPRQAFEVIVVDNGSSPPLRLVDNYPLKVRLVSCAVPGSYAARNTGASAAEGEIFAFTDADCDPAASWLQEGVAAMLERDLEHAIGGDIEIVACERRSAVALYQEATGFRQRLNIERKGFAVTANLFCTAEHFRRVGPFDERLLSGGDREWSWRAAGAGVPLSYTPNARVSTRPRTSLASAIRQARRVTAGRYHLRRYGLLPRNDASDPHFGVVSSFFWLVNLKQYTPWERVRMLLAAAIIKAVSALEALRLRLGGVAERR